MHWTKCIRLRRDYSENKNLFISNKKLFMFARTVQTTLVYNSQSPLCYKKILMGLRSQRQVRVLEMSGVLIFNQACLINIVKCGIVFSFQMWFVAFLIDVKIRSHCAFNSVTYSDSSVGLGVASSIFWCQRQWREVRKKNDLSFFSLFHFTEASNELVGSNL